MPLILDSSFQTDRMNKRHRAMRIFKMKVRGLDLLHTLDGKHNTLPSLQFKLKEKTCFKYFILYHLHIFSQQMKVQSHNKGC